jgi:microcin C transport system ATP-binding protein
VIRNGRVVEQGPARRIFAAPQHPYTQELMSASGLVLKGANAEGPITMRQA